MPCDLAKFDNPEPASPWFP